MKFEEIVFLFKCAYANRDRIRMDLDEAALLWSLVRGIRDAKDELNPVILEIGRFTGGSTILLAAAAGEHGIVVSLDIDPRDDSNVHKIIGTMSDMALTELFTGDSREMTLPSDYQIDYDLVFIDGDHTYEGVKADFERWAPKARKGGFVAFHDMVETRPDIARGFTTCCPGVNQLYREIREKERWLSEYAKAGTLAVFEVIEE